MTSRAAIRQCFDAVTSTPAGIMGLDAYGLESGCQADFVLLQAADPVEAIRLRAARLAVVRKGRLIAQSEPRVSRLMLEGRPEQVRLDRR
jgi:cytosine deaminase